MSLLRRSRIRTYETNGVTVVEIHGRLTSRSSNIHSPRDTAHNLSESGRQHLIVDLGEVTKLDGAGLGELIAICSIFANSGGSVVVTRISKAVQKTLKMAMVSPFPTMGGGPFDSVDDAIRALRTGHDT